MKFLSSPIDREIAAMPIYEYQCTKCREVCEVLQKAKDKPPEKCPKCGGSVVKLISSPAIQFKGSGWYITDHPKKGSAPAEAEAKAEAKTAPAETKAEAKPAPVEAAKPKPEKTSS
jgi:putative FmdB family regulatory protein